VPIIFGAKMLLHHELGHSRFLHPALFYREPVCGGKDSRGAATLS
jgi:hypothetical protein